MVDSYYNGKDADAPSTHFFTVVPDDAADLAGDAPKALYIGTGGDVKIIGVDAGPSATGITFKNVPSGMVLPVRPRRVLSTGTTAADIVALR